MSGFDMRDMQDMQRTLQDRYKHKWEPIGPDTGKNKLLWMIGEVGEVIDIVKKHGGEKACSDEALRQHLIEEMADVLEVLFAICEARGHSVSELIEVRNVKREKRGGFEQKIFWSGNE